MTRWLFNVGWALLVILGLSAFLIATGNPDQETDPEVSSFGTSGASALADLLRLRGYRVDVDARTDPKFSAGDVVVAYQIRPSTASVSDQSENQPGGSETQIAETTKSLHGAIKKGVTVFWLPLDADFSQEGAAASRPTVYEEPDGQRVSLSGRAPSSQAQEDAVASLASTKEDEFVRVTKIGAGYGISYGDGVGLTNRFLDQGDNAQFFLQTLRAFAPGAKRVVFSEASFGRARSVGVLETLGPWAEGGWYQILFLMAIVVITLNSRFGLPRQMRKPQTGTRELIDALTDTMIRAKATSLSLESSAEEADRRIRTLLKLPRDASDQERNRVLPEDVSMSLALVVAASSSKKVPPNEALKLTTDLEKKVDEFAASRRGISPTRATFSKRRKNLL